MIFCIDHYDDERDNSVFHKTAPELQDQDRSVQDQDQDHSLQNQDQDRFWGSQTGLVLRPTVSDHITGSLITLVLFDQERPHLARGQSRPRSKKGRAPASPRFGTWHRERDRDELVKFLIN